MIQRVIIADDSSTARMIIKRCLEIGGLSDAEFLEANDGAEALEMAKSGQIDLIVTDLNMPNMDGRTLLKHIKSSPRLTVMPVLVISSASNKAIESELVQKGALAVVNKPVTPAAVAAALENLNQDEDNGWG